MKLLAQAGEQDDSTQEKQAAQHPAGENQVAAKNRASKSEQQRVERKKNDVGNILLPAQGIAVFRDVKVPVGVPAVMKIDKIPTLLRGILHDQGHPREGGVGGKVETVEGEKGKEIDNDEPAECCCQVLPNRRGKHRGSGCPFHVHYVKKENRMPAKSPLSYQYILHLSQSLRPGRREEPDLWLFDLSTSRRGKNAPRSHALVLAR